VIARLRVDPIACDGRALCAEMLPELITLDDWGFPIIGDGPVPRRLLGDVQVTVRACPKLALKISEYSERSAVLWPDLTRQVLPLAHLPRWAGHSKSPPGRAAAIRLGSPAGQCGRAVKETADRHIASATWRILNED
jgi:ferredoxin